MLDAPKPIVDLAAAESTMVTSLIVALFSSIARQLTGSYRTQECRKVIFVIQW